MGNMLIGGTNTGCANILSFKKAATKNTETKNIETDNKN